MLCKNKANQEIINLANGQIPALLSKLNISFTQSGRWISSTCPVHKGDNRHAFGFNVDTGSWKCFTHSCERQYSNSIIGLISGVLGYDYNAAVDWLVDNLDDKPAFIANTKVRKDKIYQENCLKRLFKTDFYLKRGFQQSTLDFFEHGKAESGSMFNRIVFPIRDEKGFIRGFSGRWSGKEVEVNGKTVCYNINGKEVPKWKHTSFNKGDYLYNFYRAKEFSSEEIILVESIGNVMRWYDCGFKNCVASLGTAFTTKQSSLILSSTRRVILAGDNDEAGLKAQNKRIKMLEQYTNVQTILPPVGKDWAELSNQEVLDIYARGKKNKC